VAVELPLICDFETDDICDMQLSTASNLDWTRRIGRASEQNTGPAGAQSGSYYMLLDASMTDTAGYRAMLVFTGTSLSTGREEGGDGRTAGEKKLGSKLCGG